MPSESQSILPEVWICAYDRDDDHEFDEGETLLIGTH
jgi:hypothetical protein